MSETYGERVRRLREDAKLTPEEAGAAIDISRTAWSFVESGRTGQFTGNNAVKAAKILRVSVEELVTGKKPPPQTISPVGFRSDNFGLAAIRRAYPLISSVQAGLLADFNDQYVPCDGEKFVESDYTATRAFWLRVEGDAMEPEFYQGELILVDPDKPCSPGDYVVAKDVGTQQATFKKLTVDGGRYFLKPENRQYPVVEIDDPALRVIGRVMRHSKERKL